MEYTTENGVMGNSHAATKEKGQRLIQIYVKNIADTLCNDQLWALPV
jgi:creatinine amidohydrolase